MKTLDQLKNENRENLCIISVGKNRFSYSRLAYVENINSIITIFDNIDDDIIKTLVLYTPVFYDYTFPIFSILVNNRKHNLIFINKKYILNNEV